MRNDRDPTPPIPGQAFDAALEKFRAATGHALHVPPPLEEVTPIPSVPAVPSDQPSPRMLVQPELPGISELGIPAAMVPDAAIRLGRVVGWMRAAVEAWREYRLIEALRQLDEHLLHDVGLTREDLRGWQRSREALARLKDHAEG